MSDEPVYKYGPIVPITTEVWADYHPVDWFMEGFGEEISEWEADEEDARIANEFS